jgi:hypothetical protein
MMDDYLTVRCAGFVTYCDALIARTTSTSENLHACLFSLIGTPSQVKASSAILFGGETCRISSRDEPALELGFQGTPRTCRIRKIGETINKVMVSAEYFPELLCNSTGAVHAAVIYGPDMPKVKERAFLRLDAATTIPLKPEWQDWLWNEVLQPEKLYSFGEEELVEAYLIRWQPDKELQEQILTGISLNYLN